MHYRRRLLLSTSLALLSLCGCSALSSIETREMYRKTYTMQLHVVVTDPTTIMKEWSMGKGRGADKQRHAGFARWNIDRSVCTIYIPNEAWTELIGHEVQHCLGAIEDWR